MQLVGTPRERSGVVSFLLGDVHPHDVGTHPRPRTASRCARGTTARSRSWTALGVAATVRASVALYTTREDVDALVRALHAAREVFA